MKFLSLNLLILICSMPVAFAVDTAAIDNQATAPDIQQPLSNEISRAGAEGNKATDQVSTAEAPQRYVPAKDIREYASHVKLRLRSHVALVYDERDKEILLKHHAQQVMPVASLSKLMTAMVILDASLPMDEVITIRNADKDRIRYSRSRLRKGMQFKREDLLLMALLASENRAAAALGRTYPGGTRRFVEAMNRKAHALGLKKTHFSDPAGLGNGNVSTANELLQIVKAASEYPVIREFTTQARETITDLHTGREVKFGNTNRLVRRDSWPITLSKTGFTHDAGNCLVMQTEINNRPVIIVLLDSWGKLSKYGDSNRIKKWLIKAEHLALSNKDNDSI